MMNHIANDKPQKKNAVRIRAALIVVAVCLAGAIFATSVGIYFSTREISNTVSDDLTLLGDISSGMIQSSIGKIKEDASYVSGMMDRSYASGGIEELSATLESEVGPGPNFVSLGVVFPDGTVISSEKENCGFAALDAADCQAYLDSAPDEGVRIADSTITDSGEQLIRCFAKISDGAVFVSTLMGDYFSELLSASDYGIYSSGRVFILDGKGTVIADSNSGETNMIGSSFLDSPGEFGNTVNAALFGDETNGAVVQYMDEFENAGEIICSYTPIIHQTERWALFVTVPVSSTPIPDMRNLFLISGFIFLVFGAIASIFLSAMQAKPYEVLDRQNALLTELKAEAEAAGRAKGDFLSNMSHEIRTPLSAVIGMTAIAKSTTDENKRNECLIKIDEASHHLMGVINDILDMSKIEANKLELDPTDFSFKEMIYRVSDIVSFRIDEKHQNYSVELAPDIPPYINADEQRLAQVIANILTNAVKFTPEDGDIRLTARLTDLSEGEAEIEIAVEDSGIGLSEEQQKRLFTSFQQAESSTARKYGGTGLGLAISKHITEMMGGGIWVESEQGKGSKFSFKIKAGVADTPEVVTDISEYGLLENEFAQYRILLAEDIDINREIVRSLLEPTGVEIVDAVDGREAVDKFTAEPDTFDIIFMDVQMPELDGYDATRQIRALGTDKAKRIPIIAMTANVFKEDIDKCLAAGMNAHIGKPIDLEQVLDKLRFYLK
jgi:signal transduction histidine kinase/CheY-like chemotaxis protein